MALSATVKEDTDNAYAHWIVSTVIGDDGQPVFTATDLPAIAELDSTLIERLTSAAMRLNVNEKGQAAKN